MIDITNLTLADHGKRVVYRGVGSAGPPEYATIISFDSRRITIRVDGDTTTTLARPNEITFAT